MCQVSYLFFFFPLPYTYPCVPLILKSKALQRGGDLGMPIRVAWVKKFSAVFNFCWFFVFHLVLFFLCCTALLAEIKVFRVPDVPLTRCQRCCGHSVAQHQVYVLGKKECGNFLSSFFRPSHTSDGLFPPPAMAGCNST